MSQYLSSEANEWQYVIMEITDEGYKQLATYFNDDMVSAEIQGLSRFAVYITRGITRPIPRAFKLQQNYPNPFNPVVTVSFAIPELGFVSIGVFDVRGRKLATLANQNYQPGNYTVNWNASANATGVYFISLMISNTRLMQKVLLLK